MRLRRLELEFFSKSVKERRYMDPQELQEERFGATNVGQSPPGPSEHQCSNFERD